MADEGGNGGDRFDPFTPGDPFIDIPGGTDPLDPNDPRFQPREGEFDSAGGGENSFFDFDLDLASTINALIGFIAGQQEGKRQEENEAERKARIERARALATPERLTEITKELRPQFRELIASGLGPQFQQNLAGFLGRSGLAGTGVGTLLGGAAIAAPEIFAFSSALAEAGNVQRGQVSTELGLGQIFPPNVSQNPILLGLERAAGALFATPKKQDERVARNAPTSSAESKLFPGINA